MHYYRTEEKKGKIAGATAAVLYIIFWVVLMLVVKFVMIDTTAGEGILVNFGDSETGYGLNDPDLNTVSNVASPASSGAETPEEFLTQDIEDAPVVPDTREIRRPSERPQEQDRSQQNENPTPQREVNQRALFPGQTQGSNSSSEGNTSGSGNQGRPEGSAAGSHDGTGTGGGGAGFDLSGRSVVGSLPQPQYGANKSGRVVVQITVNPSGQVVNASYRPVGSTTNDSELVNAALQAARRSRFNEIDGEGLQTGTITYNFRLK